MASSAKYFNLKASSMLESVIALSIVSVCLFVATMVYASVFSPRTSTSAYLKGNAESELFFMQMAQQDTIEIPAGMIVGQAVAGPHLKEIIVQQKDSVGHGPARHFFILTDE